MYKHEFLHVLHVLFLVPCLLQVGRIRKRYCLFGDTVMSVLVGARKSSMLVLHVRFNPASTVHALVPSLMWSLGFCTAVHALPYASIPISLPGID